MSADLVGTSEQISPEVGAAVPGMIYGSILCIRCGQKSTNSLLLGHSIGQQAQDEVPAVARKSPEIYVC